MECGINQETYELVVCALVHAGEWGTGLMRAAVGCSGECCCEFTLSLCAGSVKMLLLLWKNVASVELVRWKEMQQLALAIAVLNWHAIAMRQRVMHSAITVPTSAHV